MRTSLSSVSSTSVLFGLFIVILNVVGNSAYYPQSKLQGLVGFAKSTTGGWNGGAVVQINNLADLQRNAGDNAPRVLVINQDIRASGITKVDLGSNKSIIGSFGKRTLFNIHLRTTPSSSNIIFQNLNFEHSRNIQANDDIQLRLNHGKNYWVDHCSFVGHAWAESDHAEDKLIYIGEKADYATISNCLFKDHRYGVILGYPGDNNPEYDGFPHLTICNNHFENVFVRAPGLMRYGYYHVYSNYINKFRMGYTLATRAKVYSENNYFEGEGTKYNSQLSDEGKGTFTDKGSVPAITNQKSPQSKWGPNSNYGYKSMSAQQAKSFTLANAGSKSGNLVFGS